MAIMSTKNYFLEAIKQELGVKEIRIDRMNPRVVPVKYHPPIGKPKIEYPSLVEWTFDGKVWWAYVLKPHFRQQVLTIGFFETHATMVDYDEHELIRVIELSKTCKDADELNYKLHGRSKPPAATDGYTHVI